MKEDKDIEWMESRLCWFVIGLVVFVILLS
jgi:hypothetical protein